MKKLNSLAIYALVTPVMVMGAGSVLAQQSAGQELNREQQSTQRDQDATQSNATPAQVDQTTQRAQQTDSLTTAEHRNAGDQSSVPNRGYMDFAPANGMQASDLIGTEVKTTGDEDVGSVDDLIIDENGQVVAIVVGAGGFLGLAEKDIAIGWDDVTRSGTSDEQELRIQVSREDLAAAPAFERRY